MTVLTYSYLIRGDFLSFSFNSLQFFILLCNQHYNKLVVRCYLHNHAYFRHSACLVDGLLYIFGGWDAPTCFNDIWVLDTGKQYDFFSAYCFSVSYNKTYLIYYNLSTNDLPIPYVLEFRFLEFRLYYSMKFIRLYRLLKGRFFKIDLEL